MRNSMAAGRRLALRAVTLQAAVAAAVALAFLLEGSASALAAGMGGGAVVAGSAVYALRTFAGGPAGAGMALARLLVGLFLKWGVVLGTLLIALAWLRLPPMPLLVGAVVTTLAFLFIGKTAEKDVM